MTEPVLPLLDLFLELRDADFQLGIAEYRELLRALQLGFGVSSTEELRQVCEALWVKSEDERRRFNAKFDRMLQTRARAQPQYGTVASPFPTTATPSTPPVTLTRTGTGSGETTPAETVASPPVRDAVPPPPESATVAAVSPPIAPETETDRAGLVHALETAPKPHSVPRRFLLTTDYYPVSSREMKQNWRYLRRMVREGPKTELDINETVRKIGREGILLDPVLVPSRQNRVELLLAVDRGGSMVPFHTLANELVNTAERGSRLGHAGIYYFHNVPVDYIYSDPSLVEANKLETLLLNIYHDRTVVLIFSDAGAARGGYNAERIELTGKFLEQLQGNVRRVAWLNPMPQTRWQGSSAAEIAQLVPMFEFTRRGMQNAIDVLRGRYVPIARSTS